MSNLTIKSDLRHRSPFDRYGALWLETMFLFAKPARPFVAWRNPAMPSAARRARYRSTISEGRRYMVLERACQGDEWVVVTVLTVLDGRPKVAA